MSSPGFWVMLSLIPFFVVRGGRYFWHRVYENCGALESYKLNTVYGVSVSRSREEGICFNCKTVCGGMNRNL
jgi:hypothetical protein